MGNGIIARIFQAALAGIIAVTGVVANSSGSYPENTPKTDRLRRPAAPSHANEERPVVEWTAHSRGNIQLAIANNGSFGTSGRTIPDPFTGEAIPSCVFPKSSNLVYLWVSAVWIGAVVGRDTLVSVGDEDYYVTNEFWPDVRPFGDIKHASIDPGNQFYSPDAYSEEDIICEYTDTLTDPNLVNPDTRDGRGHRPLQVKVRQRSMAWSYSYAEDFILFDYRVENIGTEKLEEVYLGIWVDGDVWHSSRQGPEGWLDDMVGFYWTHPDTCGTCERLDTIAVAYHTDNDGDPDSVAGSWDDKSTPHAVGVRVVRTPADSLSYSFNWWALDYGTLNYGPRWAGSDNDPYRDFGGELGTPRGDRNKYYVLSHPEFDYDQRTTALNHQFDGWLPPPVSGDAEDIADGFDCRYLLSFGPFEMNPGQTLPISFAWVAGAYLHSDPEAFETLWDPYRPQTFQSTLDFSDLARNSRWASWVYDNPGVDTDGDGYAGREYICNLDSLVYQVDTVINGRDTTIDITEYTAAETCWVIGDGVPDFNGAGPPPAPEIRVYPSQGELRVVFNGRLSETTRDVFSNIVDFEGYRVYIGRDEREVSFSVYDSYDREDYNKLIWDGSSWILRENPYTRRQLQDLYGDLVVEEDFDPERYTHSSPFIHPNYPESLFVFPAQDYNVSELGVDTKIRKVYPDQPYPSHLDPDSVEASELTEDGFLKYFEYEITIPNLQASVPYYVNVTAFDFGSPVAGLPALETSVENDYVIAYALTPGTDTEDGGHEVYVYPNPYRIDAGYAAIGYENRLEDRPTERARLLHFANLPPRCTISIFTLDGDLVKKLEHDVPAADPTSSHHAWDMITRNRQSIVSGLYYFVIESDAATQVGKFAIIK